MWWSKLDRLIKQLENAPDVSDRAKAAAALAGSPDLKAVPALLQAIKTPLRGPRASTANGRVVEIINVAGWDALRETAASALIAVVSQLTDERTIKPLKDALRDESSLVVKAAFMALCEFSSRTGSAQAVAELMTAQTRLDAESSGRPVAHRNGVPVSGADLLIETLKAFDKARKFEPLLQALASADAQVAGYAASALSRAGMLPSALEFLKKSDVPQPVFDSICARLEETHAEAVLVGLIDLLGTGTPAVRAHSARRLRRLADGRARAAVQEWEAFLKDQFHGATPPCPACSRPPSEQMENGNYWCSWCGVEYALADVYAAGGRKANAR